MEHRQNRLIDQYNRSLNYLRISVTDRCNLRCVYCLPDGHLPKLKHEDILSYEEIHRLAKIAVDLGVIKIRLTGGEPLVRKGIYELIPKIKNLSGLKELSLTTNGIYLKDNIEKLRAGGIKRINVSLDTLNREKYKKITGFDGFDQVLEGIELARESGFHPIKINVVLIKGLNDDEILNFARLSIHRPYHIRFIEHMPLGNNGHKNQLHHVPNIWTKNQLNRMGRIMPVVKTEFDGPAERFKFPDAAGEIGFISPVTEHFCYQCNRLRLTARGHLRPCLLSDLEEDLKTPMRSGASDAELKRIFLATASKKPHKHDLDAGSGHPFSSFMSSIGG